MNFVNPTKGRMDINKMFQDIMEFVEEDRNSNYKLMVGTDSQPGKIICFVTAIIIYREGNGARYYYRKFSNRRIPSFKQRIFMEANYSIELANQLLEKLSKTGRKDLNIEIHLDVGENGKTKEIIKEVVGMVTGCGFEAQVKPDSYGASKVADKYTKSMTNII
ncbi:ribonuclease H-like YkuK family protein [Aceticella autotrophica]|uniref:Ribonuclease H-like YkuK family protein n=1 Tax=Aceticella autotrophica TaxID=2755338 RepID=A0A975AXL9_9THEO|nr:ribonuclease H-like YkuK family protein [Aceticella autotrophica]QSZ28335.1 ribonuclease H-like YkuK family protein [Aceticella autotrophica]